MCLSGRFKPIAIQPLSGYCWFFLTRLGGDKTCDSGNNPQYDPQESPDTSRGGRIHLEPPGKEARTGEVRAKKKLMAPKMANA